MAMGNATRWKTGNSHAELEGPRPGSRRTPAMAQRT